METAPTITKRPARWTRVAFWIAGIVLVLGIVPLGAYWMWGMYESFQVMEATADHRNRGEPVTADALAAWTALPGDNMVPPFRKAVREILPYRSEWHWVQGQSWKGTRPLPPADAAKLREMLTTHAPLLDAVSAATRMPGVRWAAVPGTAVKWFDVLEVNRVSALGDLLACAAVLAHQDRNDAAALDRVKELIVIGRALQRNPSWIGFSQGMKHETRGVEILEKALLPTLKITGNQAGARDLIALLNDRGTSDLCWRGMIMSERLTALERERAALSGGGVSAFLSKPFVCSDLLTLFRYSDRLLAAGSSADWPTAKSMLPLDKPSPEMDPSDFHLFGGSLMLDCAQVLRDRYQLITAERALASSLATKLDAPQSSRTGSGKPATMSATRASPAD